MKRICKSAWLFRSRRRCSSAFGSSSARDPLGYRYVCRDARRSTKPQPPISSHAMMFKSFQRISRLPFSPHSSNASNRQPPVRRLCIIQEQEANLGALLCRVQKVCPLYMFLSPAHVSSTAQIKAAMRQVSKASGIHPVHHKDAKSSTNGGRSSVLPLPSALQVFDGPDDHQSHPNAGHHHDKGSTAHSSAKGNDKNGKDSKQVSPALSLWFRVWLTSESTL